MNISGRHLSLPGALAGRATEFIAFIVEACRAATAKHLLYTTLLALAWGMLTYATASVGVGALLPAGPLLNITLGMQFNGLAVLFAVLLADRASPPELRRWWPYALAVSLGVLVGTLLLTAVSQRLLGVPTHFNVDTPQRIDPFFYRHSTHSLVFWGLVTFVYVSRRWAAHRLAALRAMQLRSAAMETEVLKSRLAALQARVEPHFLQDALARVERLYETDRRAADRVLKDLIAYLRTAIPQIRDPVSTVEREVRLANAYLNIVHLRSADALTLNPAEKAIANEARLPPMVLLPLIKHAIAGRTDVESESLMLEVGVALHDNRLRLTIRDWAAGFATNREDDANIIQVRERFAVIYGAEAQLTLRGTEAVMEIPHERVAGSVSQ